MEHVDYEIYKTEEKGLFAFRWIARDLEGKYITCALTKVGLKHDVKQHIRKNREHYIGKDQVRV